MLEVKPTGQHGCTATGSGRNGRGISFRRQRGDTLLNNNNNNNNNNNHDSVFLLSP